MKVSMPVSVLWIVLLGALSFASADGGGNREKRVEKSEVRTRSDGTETRERHRAKVEKRTDKADDEHRSGHEERDHSERKDESRNGSDRGPG